jgi:lipoprotein-anchoring transpeptidase ErfK/SrfK
VSAGYNRYAAPALMLAWLGVFSGELCGVVRWFSKLSRLDESFEATAADLDIKSRQIAAAQREIKAGQAEVAFLQELPNILPQEKGYLRTQKAMMEEVAGLRSKVGKRLKNELHIVIDAKSNKLYLKSGLKLLWQADCSVGRGGILVDKKTKARWEFVTPRGEFKVLGKKDNPLWIKPDWAFVEAGQAVPAKDDPSRMVEGELGAYVLNLGDGYLIHGTKDESVLGRAVSHGCVRLGAADLKKLYETVPVGTKVYIIG